MLVCTIMVMWNASNSDINADIVRNLVQEDVSNNKGPIPFQNKLSVVKVLFTFNS